MTEGVPVATGDVDAIENLHARSGSVFLTCSERSSTACTYRIEPDRPDDYELVALLDYPYCVSCGVTLVIVPRGRYEGPGPKFRDLDRAGSPVVYS